MPFSMMGSRGQVRHRSHPKGYGQGPRGEVDKHGKRATRKAQMDAVRPVFSPPTQERGTLARAAAAVRRVFSRARGNR